MAESMTLAFSVGWKTQRSATKAELSVSEKAARLLCAGIIGVSQTEPLPSTWSSHAKKNEGKGYTYYYTD